MKARRLSRGDRRIADAAEIDPLRLHVEELRARWRTALRDTSPDPAVSLAANLTVTSREFREYCADACEASGPQDRRLVDYYAAYGVEAAEPDKRIRATPLALLNGSGHQNFLGSVAGLMVDCAVAQIDEAVFGPWQYRDEKSSLRLDPAEDRRYALMAADPTAAGNKPRTVWGANRLAFEALPLFPMVARRGRARTACVTGFGREDARFCWPLWTSPLSASVVRSLLALGMPERPDLPAAAMWRARGVAGVWASRRIAVGSGANVKYNLTPAVACWS